MSLIPLSSVTTSQIRPNVIHLITTVKVEKLPHFQGFERGSDFSGAIDLKATEAITIGPQGFYKMPMGFKMELLKDQHAFLIPRSGLGSKGLVLKNIVGFIDNDYRGEVFATLWNTSSEDMQVEVGDRVIQMYVQELPSIHIDIVDQVNSTERGEGGFGSSGK